MDFANPKGPERHSCHGTPSKAELLAARQKLASDGPAYWRSLQELANDPDFRERLQREFPKGASEWLEPLSRRDFLSLMGASFALAGLTSCVKQPAEQIVPYVVQPENITPGKQKFYATAMTFSGYGIPLLVTSNMGRPTKIEGNPQHAASLGASDIFSQASILDLYDPDRSQTVLFEGKPVAWPAFVGAIRPTLLTDPGQRVRILTQNVSSPTLAAQIQMLLRKCPNARWHVWEPANRNAALMGSRLALGEPVETQFNFAKADVIFSVDADFLYPTFPGFQRYSRD